MKVKIVVNESGKGTCEIDGQHIEGRLQGFEVKADAGDATQVTLYLIATEVDLEVNDAKVSYQDDTSTADSSTTDSG